MFLQMEHSIRMFYAMETGYWTWIKPGSHTFFSNTSHFTTHTKPFCKQSKWVVVSFLLVCLFFISNLKPPALAPLPAVTGKHATTYNQSVPMLTPSSPPSMHRAHINTLAYSKYLSLFQWHKTLSNCAHFGRTLLLPTLKIVSLHTPNRYTNWILNKFFK